MATPRLAHALVVLRSQVNAAWPGRSKKADGWIGDAAHAARKSDHNPNAAGVVTAIDLTHDPVNGFDAHAWVRNVLVRSGDRRLEYVISNGQIWTPAKGWRKYTGANPHDKHVHVSVLDVPEAYDSEAPWQVLPVQKLRLVVMGQDVAGALRNDQDRKSGG